MATALLTVENWLIVVESRVGDGAADHIDEKGVGSGQSIRVEDVDWSTIRGGWEDVLPDSLLIRR